MHARLPVLVLLTWSAAGAQAPLELGSPFVDDMILQRQMPVPVWGWAAPGTAVSVAFAGQEKTGEAGPKGRWTVRLDPLEASTEERELVVRAGDARLARKGVLVGEVWFASGQSNMDWIAGKSMCRDLANQLRRGDPPVREYNVDIGSALYLRSRGKCKDGWQRSQHASGFSALALAFAWDLHQALKVPVGILRATHGATPIETWTPYEGFAGRQDLQHIARHVRESDPTTAEGKAAWARYEAALRGWQEESARLCEAGGRPLPQPALPGIAAEWKGPTRMFNQKIAPLIPYAIRGAIWCQGTHNAGDGKIYAAKMHALVDGWRKTWGRPDLPFYFTQMQCYGDPDPEKVGFADIREAQRRFFMESQNVGMVPQYDLNPARPGGIHYTNKLDPGKRLARWALAHQYGKDIAYTGPIYASHRVDGSAVRVRFAQRGPGGGLMAGSKGMEADQRKGPDAYVEPARETPGAKLQHWRLAGRDRVWHPAEAVIDGDEVVVTSAAVQAPAGVSYAYSQSPIGANLYNRAGLPATPFAVFDGKPLFQEDVRPVRAEPAAARPAPRPYVQIATPYRAGAVVQRDRPLPVWGFALAGAEVTVRFAGQEKTGKADAFERWRVTLDPLPAAAKGRPLEVTCSDGARATVPDVVVGDLWVLTGSTRVSGELLKEAPAPLPLVREFRIRTNARRFREPRKRRMEVGGGKYTSRWVTATFDGRPDVTVAGYHFAAQVQEEGVPVGVINLGADNPPLTWISYAGLQTAAGFERERDELDQLYPNTAAGKAAVTSYIETLRRYNREVATRLQAGDELSDELAAGPPEFPQPKQDQWAKYTENATLTYNFCISPLTPMAVRGVAWIPGEHNVGENPARYGPALTALAQSLPGTFGQATVPFVYAQPAPALAAGITKPVLPGVPCVELDAWPKSHQQVAERLGALAVRR